jgi:hypothetical protein
MASKNPITETAWNQLFHLPSSGMDTMGLKIETSNSSWCRLDSNHQKSEEESYNGTVGVGLGAARCDQKSTHKNINDPGVGGRARRTWKKLKDTDADHNGVVGLRCKNTSGTMNMEVLDWSKRVHRGILWVGWELV